jgi:predicted metal-dependent enzyme (double-stranded beta helix superfamily)
VFPFLSQNLQKLAMEHVMLPALETFIAEFRSLYALDIDDLERFQRGTPLLKALISDPELVTRSANWPSRNDPEKGHYENLLFYEDPDYEFVLNALIKEPGEATPVHDHGDVLTVYGVLKGGETVKRYRRIDPGLADDNDEGIVLELMGDKQVLPGYIDFVPPGEIHVEYNGPHRTIGLILRNGNVGKKLQSWYDMDLGNRKRRYGPTQVPFTLK